MKFFSTLLACTIAASIVTSCSDSSSENGFCDSVAELQQIDALSLEVLPSNDVAVRGALAQTAAQASRVAREAPLEIRGDAEVIAAFLSALTYAIDATEFEEPLQRSAAIGAAHQECADRVSKTWPNNSPWVTTPG